MPSRGLPGGISKAINEDERKTIIEAGVYGIEMAFRAYDPCHACATHSLPGQMPLEVIIYNSKREVVEKLSQHCSF